MSVRNSEMALFCMFNLSRAPVLTRLAPLCVRPARLTRVPSFSSARFNQKCRKILKACRRSAVTAVRPCQSGTFHIFYWQLIFFFFPKELNDSLRHLFNLIIKLTGVFGGKQISKQMHKHTDKAQQSSGYVATVSSKDIIGVSYGRTLPLIFRFIFNRVFLTNSLWEHKMCHIKLMYRKCFLRVKKIRGTLHMFTQKTQN